MFKPKLSASRRIQIPSYDNGNAWYNILSPPPPAKTLEGALEADWAVLGAGACGLACARQLAELRPDDVIVLLESSRVGFGASGRNAGFLLNHNTHGEVKEFAVERRNSLLCAAGYRYLKSLVDQHSIECDWSDWGRLYVAAGADGDRHLSELQDNYRVLEIASHIVEKEPLSDMLGTQFYRRGLMAHGNGLVNPAALMRGLAATLPNNVVLYEDSPIVSITTGQRHVLESTRGTVSCTNLILANSVFLQDMGIMSNHIVPMATFGSLSIPLSERERACLGSASEFALLPAHPNGSTVRLLTDGRLLMRNTYRYAPHKRFEPGKLEEISRTHRQSIAQRWPGLGDVEFEGTWGGLLGFTRNDGTIWGELDNRLYAVISSDASPVTRGSIAGKLLADHICGEADELLPTMRSLPRAALLPPTPILRLVLNHKIRSIEKTGTDEI